PPQFAVGIIAFSTEPNVVAPVTTDRSVTRAAINYLLPEGGTAIGDAIDAAVRLARNVRRPLEKSADARAPTASILLMSDGAQRSGVLTPEDGAREAKTAGLRIYTVALGTPEGTVGFGFGAFQQTVPVPPDPDTLRRIAQITGGEFFA